jgi:histidinol dehydrogenase
LLAQAEHGSGYERIFCISSSNSVLKTIAKEIQKHEGYFLNNSGLTHVLKENTWFIKCRENRLAGAANTIAPEHLQIMTRSPRKIAEKIHTAGAIFFGNFSPTVLGDFVAGPSHTLLSLGFEFTIFCAEPAS